MNKKFYILHKWFSKNFSWVPQLLDQIVEKTFGFYNHTSMVNVSVTFPTLYTKVKNTHLTFTKLDTKQSLQKASKFDFCITAKLNK